MCELFSPMLRFAFGEQVKEGGEKGGANPGEPVHVTK